MVETPVVLEYQDFYGYTREDAVRYSSAELALRMSRARTTALETIQDSMARDGHKMGRIVETGWVEEPMALRHVRYIKVFPPITVTDGP